MSQFSHFALLCLITAGSGLAQESVLYRLSTYAGIPRGANVPATASTVSLGIPFGVVTDRDGNIYIADYENNLIRGVAPDGLVRTIAGTGTRGSTGNGGPAIAAQIQAPRSLAIDPAHRFLYFSEQIGNRVRRIDLTTGIITVAAGDGATRFNGDGLAGPATSFNEILGLAVGANGDVFIVDTNNHRIRKLTIASGLVSTVAGSGQQGFSGDNGPALQAALNRPSAVAVAPDGTVYFFDLNNKRLRRVANGTIATFAGNPNATAVEGPGLQVSLSVSTGIALDAAGSMLYMSTEDTHRVRRVRVSDAAVTVIAGTGVAGPAVDGGPALRAVLNTPTNVTVDAEGRVVIADSRNNRVRRINADGNIVSVAGGSKWGAADTTRDRAVFDQPSNVALDPDGLLVVDYGNCAIRLVTPERVTYAAGAPEACQFPTLYSAVRDAARNLFYSTANGTGLFYKPSNAAAGVARINQPIFGLAVNPAGTSLYFAQNDGRTLARVQSASSAALAGTGTAIATNIAGSTPGRSGDGGPATGATLAAPAQLSFDSAGNLLVWDAYPPHQIRKIATDGLIATAYTETTTGLMNGMTVDAEGMIWYSTTTNQVVRLAPDGKSFLAVLGDGVAGYSDAIFGRFSRPLGLAAGPDGSIYVADTGNHVIRRLTPVVARLEVVSGDKQTGAPGAKLAVPIRVRAFGDDGAPFGGYRVRVFRLPVTGTTPDFFTTTDSEGIAEFKELVLPDTPGEIKFEAFIGPGQSTVEFTVTAVNKLISVATAEGGHPELSPNALATATGSGLAAESIAAGASDLVEGSLPLKLGGVCVDLGGVRAPVASVSPTSVTFVVPATEPSDVPLKLLLRCGEPDEEATNVLNAAIRAASPSWIFWTKAKETALHPIQVYDAESGAPLGRPGLEGADHPAAVPGQTVRLTGAGFGATNPPGIPGQAPTTENAAPTVESPVVTIGGSELPADALVYSGLARNQPGRYSLVIRLPESLADGDHEVIVRFGYAETPRGGFVTVKK